MTPLEIAVEAFRLNEYRPDNARVEAAITAYLTALSEDEATVEKVARGICAETVGPPDAMEAWEYDPAGPVTKQLKRAPLWTKSKNAATAALTALASRDGEKS